MKYLGEINSDKSVTTKEYVDEKVKETSCCATGSFVNDSTAVNRCDTGFGAKPKIFKLYFADDAGGLTLGAELRPDLDADLQKFIYDDLPIITLGASAAGFVGIKFSEATNKTFIWEAYI